MRLPADERGEEVAGRGRRLRKLLRRWRDCRKGITAVEFGFVVVPFIGLIFAIIETALVFWSNQVLETAVAKASRQIYTGEFQTAPANAPASNTTAQLATKFKTLVCAEVSALFDCNGKVKIDVRPASTFGGATASSPVTSGQFDTTGYGYQAVAARDIAVVRAAMEYPAWTAFLGNTSGLVNGRRIIMATAVFKTEPFQ